MTANVKSKAARELEALLEFYSANGVDCALDEAPHDRLAEFEATREARLKMALNPEEAPSTQPTRNHTLNHTLNRQPATGPGPPTRLPQQQPRVHPSSPTVTSPSNTPQAMPDALAVQSARDLALAAQTLDDLRDALASFDGCNLKRTAKNLVFGDGSENARVMFVGEAPGRDEDIQGVPFVGRSGQLLDRMLEAIGLDRQKDVYIANVIPWRPPGNRTPTPQETELCRPFIERQIALVNPNLLVPLGGSAAKQLFKTSDGILKLRGKIKPFALRDREISAMATLHPAYLLRQPGQKRLAWQDFLKIKRQLDGAADASVAKDGLFT